MWVVTILHDLTEALEKARLYEQLKRGAAELERKVQEATAELARAERAAAAAAHRARAGVGAEVAVPRQHVARVPDAAQRDPRLHAHAAATASPGAISDQQRKSLTRIDSNSRHLLALINDILDITRIEAGRMPLNLTTFDVPELVDEVMSELEPIIKRSKLTVTAKMARSLRAAQERPAEGEADRAQPAEQCAEVHAGRVGDDCRVV